MRHTQKARLARVRNHTKFRILGIFINTDALTESELKQVNIIRASLKTLITNWDTESSKLGLNVIRYDVFIINPVSKEFDLVYPCVTLKFAKAMQKAYCAECRIEKCKLDASEERLA